MHNSELIDIRQKISRKQSLLDNIQAINNIPKKLKVDVLMVDDDHVACTVYKKYLDECDQVSRVVTKNSVDSAFAYLKELHNKRRTFPKLIILDLNMPGMDGNEFLEKFSALYSRKGTKILIFTSIEPNCYKFLNYDKVIGYLTKPLTVSEVETIINQEIVA